MYFPIFVSVKNYGYMRPSDAADFLYDSWSKLKKAGVQSGLCILAIAGQDRPEQNVSSDLYKRYAVNQNKKEDHADLAKALNTNSWSDISNTLVPSFLCINDDTFGIHKALLSGTTVKDQQMAEIFTSHSELIHRSMTVDEVVQHTRSYRKEGRDLFCETVDCIRKYEQNKGK